MNKLIFNNETEHMIEVENFNFSTIFKIDDYSNHTDNINFTVINNSVSLLNNFENTPITNIKILNSNQEEIVALSFNEALYILNYNGNIYDNNLLTNVYLGKVNISNEEEI